MEFLLEFDTLLASIATSGWRTILLLREHPPAEHHPHSIFPNFCPILKGVRGYEISKWKSNFVDHDIQNFPCKWFAFSHWGNTGGHKPEPFRPQPFLWFISMAIEHLHCSHPRYSQVPDTLSGPPWLRDQSRSRTWSRIAASIAFLFRACFF